MPTISLPLVTIAIPTFNRADRYLRDSLQSTLDQTYPHIEIIVSDNGSVDGTEQFVKSVSDPRLRYFRHSANIGSTNNFNFCLDQAKGDYFLLLQDDDLIDCDFVETCVAAASGSSEAGIIRTGTRLIDGDGKIIGERRNSAARLSTDAFFRAWFAGKTALYLCSTLFHAPKLKAIGGFKSKYNCYDDVLAEAVLAARHGRVDLTDVKASSRVHENNLTYAMDIRKWCEDSLEVLDVMCGLVSENAALVRHDGMRFFSRANYRRAGAITSPMKRLAAYMTVFKHFNYRYPPPLRLVITRTWLYQQALPIGRWIKLHWPANA